METFLPPLDLQEEKEYLNQVRGGSLEARNALVIHNMRLVAHIAKKYQNVEEDMEELISIGTIGLIKAVSSFHPEKGSRLSTYAARCIDNELLMYLRSRRKLSKEVSLYEPIGTDKEGNQIQFLDIMESAEPDVVEQMDCNYKIKKLRGLIPKLLSKREQTIIVLRYGLAGDSPVTQKMIARKLGISRSYVSRIEKRALEKMRFALNGPEETDDKDK